MAKKQPDNINIMTLPMLPLRDVVVYPHMVIPLFVGREKSIAALEEAMAQSLPVFLLAQRQASSEDPSAEELYELGTLATVLQMLKLPDGTVKVLVEGLQRAEVKSIEKNEDYFVAHVEPVDLDEDDSQEIEALRRALLTQFDQFVKLNKKIPGEVLSTITSIVPNGQLADTIAAHLQLKLEQRQQVLEVVDVALRLEHLLQQLEEEIDILQVEKRIRGRVKRQMEKSQREYYLNEQVKAIQ
ncbi:MAG: LON peptidase substrate-binding domain-containing protein, partial [Neisseriaceae bacterium]|nr:LON peptidase substrate-binding domain-containing protein [Neisseriaceae bacterium]